MYKVCRIICTTLIMCLIIPFLCKADSSIKINDLIEKGKELDNNVITIKAEAIGEPLPRGEFIWVNVNDGTNSIGIWMKKEVANKIKLYGNYKQKGDVIEVKGVFTRNCKRHGGDLDIHAETVILKESGVNRETKINSNRLRAAVILMMSTAVLGFVYYAKNRI